MKIRLIILLLACHLAAFTPRTITWTAIGDSITYLNDHIDETGNRITSGYLAKVAANHPNIKYINQGHNGWTTVGIAKEIENLGLTKTDIYTVFLGTNDWWSGLPLGSINDYINNTGYKTTYGAYRIIINKIRRLNPNAQVILITPMQRGDFVYIADAYNNAYGCYKPKNGQELSQFADAVKEIGNHEHFKVIDLYYKSGMTVKNVVKFKRLKDTVTGFYRNFKYPRYKGVPFNPGIDEYPYPPDAIGYTYDGLHPSDKGYKVIAGMIINEFKKAGYLDPDTHKN
ncbi:MAG: SGNH/GDSL hydrolase family protein [Bacteroidota bacterium]|nr:SGNH/GDSL hydrolase family protein [Bacteroidota bacterium]